MYFTLFTEIFHAARVKLNQNISRWGYLKDKEEYYKVLEMADVVVSTAKHEFFGVAMQVFFFFFSIRGALLYVHCFWQLLICYSGDYTSRE